MTTQKAYELMRVYLTRPGAQRAFFDVCRYETVVKGEVHRCAVGCLLTPATLASTVEIEHGDNFDESMWGSTVPLRSFLGNIEALYQAGYSMPELDNVDDEFLFAAQAAHDNIENWQDGSFNVDKLDAAAAACGLRVVTEQPAAQADKREELVVTPA